MSENTIISFEKIEKEIQKIYLSECREKLTEILKEIDEYLYNHCDKNVFCYKETIAKSFHTLFGTIQIKRRTYQIGLENGESKIIALLDEILSGKTYGRFTKAVAEIICKWRKENKSYGEIRDKLDKYHEVYITRPSLQYMYNRYAEKIFLKTKAS